MDQMNTSKYAPKTPAERVAQSKAEKLKQDKERVTRLLGRLRWKAEMLWVSYMRTMEIIQATAAAQQHQDQSQHDKHTMGSGTSSTQAETMFKIDFFEFYTLLERYMTDCLALFGISVSAAVTPRQNFNALRYEVHPELHRTRPLASHAFHANLLEALDNAEGPLAGSLGEVRVRAQLGRAKEFRNAWKDVSTGQRNGNGNGNAGGEGKAVLQLQDLGLQDMLQEILWGCEEAERVVQAYDNKEERLTTRDFEPKSTTGTTMYDGGGSMEIEDMPFEYMDDAMDLD
ncbi:fungal specific transcription factor [Pyrenophora seminiperda CCB06]|uniref:Fungal specific transcription factor n=1 Tax=Pyrenophora seminiperda CCB06 TaxID=1302712 RepID=A0A3M7MGN7_9PLEO|nr:fungal specific transcription factor [Pyrenophora seminiperda CCB06]